MANTGTRRNLQLFGSILIMPIVATWLNVLHVHLHWHVHSQSRPLLFLPVVHVNNHYVFVHFPPHIPLWLLNNHYVFVHFPAHIYLRLEKTYHQPKEGLIRVHLLYVYHGDASHMNFIWYASPWGTTILSVMCFLVLCVNRWIRRPHFSMAEEDLHQWRQPSPSSCQLEYAYWGIVPSTATDIDSFSGNSFASCPILLWMRSLQVLYSLVGLGNESGQSKQCRVSVHLQISANNSATGYILILQRPKKT